MRTPPGWHGPSAVPTGGPTPTCPATCAPSARAAARTGRARRTAGTRGGEESRRRGDAAGASPGRSTGMYARTTTVRGDPSAVEDGIACVRDEIWPAVQHMSGCVGLSMLADREAGRCIVTTAWATDEAMRASAESVKELRSRAAEMLHADAVDVMEYEIAVLHRAHAAGDAACARVQWADAPSGQLDATID